MSVCKVRECVCIRVDEDVSTRLGSCGRSDSAPRYACGSAPLAFRWDGMASVGQRSVNRSECWARTAYVPVVAMVSALYVLPSDAHVEALTPDVIAFGDGAFGR